MLTLSKNRPARGSVCHRCQVIRFFVICAVMLAIFALVADDRLHYLQAVTPMRAAIAIWIVGIAGFVVKLVLWRLDERQAQARNPADDASGTSDDREQA